MHSDSSRTRIITFRLTRQQNERIRELCDARGRDSMSSLIRSAVNQFLREADLDDEHTGTPEIQRLLDTPE